MITNNKGLSGIVTTLIIIGVGLAAVGVVWYVLNTTIETQKESVEGYSEKAFQDCVPAGYVLMDEDNPLLDVCTGTVKYVGGNMCCNGTVS